MISLWNTSVGLYERSGNIFGRRVSLNELLHCSKMLAFALLSVISLGLGGCITGIDPISYRKHGGTPDTDTLNWLAERVRGHDYAGVIWFFRQNKRSDEVIFKGDNSVYMRTLAMYRSALQDASLWDRKQLLFYDLRAETDKSILFGLFSRDRGLEGSLRQDELDIIAEEWYVLGSHDSDYYDVAYGNMLEWQQSQGGISSSELQYVRDVREDLVMGRKPLTYYSELSRFLMDE